MFTIVTPSYCMLDGLKRCAASIADQSGVTVQHVIQDSCSPGIESIQTHLETLRGLHAGYQPELHVEKDTGIYQAVNRGLRRARHDYLAYLNCDEQYLPDALERVARYFEENPNVEVVFGDTVFVNEAGELVHYQKTILPRPSIIQLSHLPAFTCSTFFRRSVFAHHEFREDLRAVSDAYWVLALLRSGVKMGLLNAPTSVFECRESNASKSPRAQEEKEDLRRHASAPVRLLSPIVRLAHKVEKALHGCYLPRRVDYWIYQDGASRSAHAAHAFGVTRRPAA